MRQCRPGDARPGASLRSKQTRRGVAQMMEFTIGTEASCTDGVCGEVIRVVVDPVARAVTHLAIEPKHRQGLARLVPLALVDATAGEVRLRCTIAEFERLDPAEETQFVPGSPGYAAYRPDGGVAWPYSRPAVRATGRRL